MIQSKQDYKVYLEADRIALNRKKYTLYSFFFDTIWNFQRLLRKVEYLTNCKKGLFWKTVKWFYYLRLLRYRDMFMVPVNTCDAGLSISHSGTVIINALCKVGKNFHVHPGVVLGRGKSDDEVPIIGDNVHLGPGVKIIGPIVIGDNTVVAANAVVTKSFPEGNCTLGGVPAKVISSTTSLTPYEKAGRGLVVQGYEEAIKSLAEVK